LHCLLWRNIGLLLMSSNARLTQTAQWAGIDQECNHACTVQQPDQCTGTADHTSSSNCSISYTASSQVPFRVPSVVMTLQSSPVWIQLCRSRWVGCSIGAPLLPPRLYDTHLWVIAHYRLERINHFRHTSLFFLSFPPLIRMNRTFLCASVEATASVCRL